MKKKLASAAVAKAEQKNRAKMYCKAADLLAESDYAKVLSNFCAEQMHNLDLDIFLLQRAKIQTIDAIRNRLIKSPDDDVDVRDYVFETLFRLSENYIPAMIRTLDRVHDRAWAEFNKADVANGYEVQPEA